MSFYKQDFSSRFGAMGDESEGMFDSVAKDSVAPFGLNRPPVNLTNVSPFVRYMPDRLQHNRLVECMGVGRDCTLKLKLEKLYALMEWDRHHNVWLFIWDSNLQRYTEQTIWEVARQCNAQAEMKRFPEGKPAWFLRLHDCVTWEWTSA